MPESLQTCDEQSLDQEKLLTSWGYEGNDLKEALAVLRNPRAIQRKVIDFGTTALDNKRKGDFHTDPFIGTLALVDRQNHVIDTDQTFEEPDPSLLEGAHAGGTANAANAIGKMLATERELEGDRFAIESIQGNTQRRMWALMARLGDDDVAKFWKAKIHPEIDTGLLDTVPGATSGLSDVRIQEADSDEVLAGMYAIYFRAGASGATLPTRDDLLRIAASHPTLVNISYPGLFKDGMDRDKGTTTSLFIRELQKFCPMVTIDLHGFTKLEHVKKSLNHVDMAKMNLKEAASIFLGETLDAKTLAQPGAKTALLRRIEEKARTYFEKSTGRTRAFFITDAAGCHVIFQGKDGKVESKYCDSPCAAIPAKDTTGAGDVFYGFTRFVLSTEFEDPWREGMLRLQDIVRPVQEGQIASTLHIQGKEANAMAGMTRATLRNAAASGECFTDVTRLREVTADQRTAA